MKFKEEKLETLKKEIIKNFTKMDDSIISEESRSIKDIIEFKYILNDSKKNIPYDFTIVLCKLTNKINIKSSNNDKIKKFFNFCLDEESIKENSVLIEKIKSIFVFWKFSNELKINLNEKVNTKKETVSKFFSKPLYEIKNTLIGLINVNTNIYKSFNDKIYILSVPKIIFMDDKILSFHTIKLNIDKSFKETFKNKSDLYLEEDLDYYNKFLFEKLVLNFKLILGKKVMRIFNNLNENDIIRMPNEDFIEHVNITLISNY